MLHHIPALFIQRQYPVEDVHVHLLIPGQRLLPDQPALLGIFPTVYRDLLHLLDINLHRLIE